MMAKANIEAFAKAGEKNIFKNMFGGSDSDSDSDVSEKEQYDFLTTTHAPTSMDDSATADTEVEVYSSIHNTFEVLLHQEKRKGIAHQLWPAATFLSHYLEQNWDTICSISSSSSSSSSSATSSSNSASGNSTDQHDLINVIELGAGIGLCGLVCSKLQCNKVNKSNCKAYFRPYPLTVTSPLSTQVVLTDLPVAIPLLQTNIALNQHNVAASINQDTDISIELDVEKTMTEGIAAETAAPLPLPPSLTTAPTHSTVTAAVLSWGDKTDADNVMRQFQPGQRVVCIAADCVYWEILFVPLFETLKTLVIEYHVEVIIAHVKRWKKDEKFFRMCKKCMNVEVLVENISMVPHEHTGIPTREVKRIYRIYQCNTG